MRFQLLEYFCVLAESRSVNRAAQTLHISQPSLTKSLKSMEEELGLRLFIRSHTGISLTPEGEKVYRDARHILSLRRGWRDMSLQGALHADIFSHISLDGFLIPEIIVELHEKYPSLSVNYQTRADPAAALTPDAPNPTLVFTICGKNAAMPDGIVCRPLFSGAYGCLVSKKSRLACRKSVAFQDLMEHSLLLPNFILEDVRPRGGQTAAINGFLPDMMLVISDKRIIVVGSVNNVIKLVRERPQAYALSFSPAHYRYPGVCEGDLVHVPLSENDVDGTLCLMYRKGTPAALPAFGDLVAACADSAARFLHSIPSAR